MPGHALRHRVPALGPSYAASFHSAASQTLSIADNADLGGAGTVIDLTLAGWVWFDAFNTNPPLAGKRSNATGQIEYSLFLQTSTNQFRAQISSTGSAVTGVNAVTFGAAALNVWYFVVWSWDGTNLKVGVNNTGFDTVGFTSTLFNGTAAFVMGANDGGTPSLDGRLQNWAVWRSATGAGGALTANQIAALYNGGAGRSYRELPGFLRPALVAYWDLDGDWRDKTGRGNDLTNNNGVVVADGKR